MDPLSYIGRSPDAGLPYGCRPAGYKKGMVIIMRKQRKTTFAPFCTFLLCTALSCTLCACGSGNGTPDAADSDTAQESAADDTSRQPAQETGSEADMDAASAGSTGQAAEENAGGTDTRPEDAVPGDPETDTTVSIFPTPIRIEMKREENTLTAEDGTVYCTTSCAYPVIHLAKEGNVAIEKINADIRSRVDSFLADTEVEEWAKEGYDYSIQEESEYPFNGYYDDMTFGVERADDNVISFTVTYYTFTGGAHGNYTTQGINYNAKTGDPIAFSDLSDDAGAFHEDTLAYNQNLAKTEAYQMRMFSDDMLPDGSLESVLYTDDAWYLSVSGLTFISDPYALGPYAAGTIEFVIPYADLAGMGFHPGYAYADRVALRLFADTDTGFDLNGDGDKDTIRFSAETVANEDDTYTTTLHLVINDVDFSAQGDAVVKELLTGNFWSGLSLFDLNVDDDYTELAALSGESIDNNFIYHSYFFRYTKNGALLYLGKAEGDALDPTVNFTELEP